MLAGIFMSVKESVKMKEACAVRLHPVDFTPPQLILMSVRIEDTGYTLLSMINMSTALFKMESGTYDFSRDHENR